MRRQRATLAWLRELRDVPCHDCGGRFPAPAMDFDHRDPSQKKFQLTTGRALLKNRAELLNEIAKCDIVCANCHRARTHRAFLDGSMRAPSFWLLNTVGTKEQMRGRLKFQKLWREQMAFLRELRTNPCADCKGTFPWLVMEFDHRDPALRVRNVPLMAGRAGTSRLLEEIEKCDIVCGNCHRIRTFRQRQRQRQRHRGSSTEEMRLPSKQDIAGSNPVSRSDNNPTQGIADPASAYRITRRRRGCGSPDQPMPRKCVTTKARATKSTR